MHRLASDGEHASRVVLLVSLVVGVALGSLLPRDIPGENLNTFNAPEAMVMLHPWI